jgi:hypothetical protein
MWWTVQAPGKSQTPSCLAINASANPSRDTFTGVYAAEYLQQKQDGEWNIRAAVERACRASALTITRFGAQEGIPWSDEIDNFQEIEVAERLSQANLDGASEAATEEEL